MMKTGLTLCLLLALMAGGCFATREDRINQLRSTHPQWSPGTIEKVADGQIEAGMTEEMVRAAMGKPWSVTLRGDVTVWEYSRFRRDTEGTSLPRSSFFINFQNGKVTGTEGDQSAALR
jgi:hypothetical protein